MNRCPDSAGDLVVTMDDATSEHTSMFFCAEEGTDSSFHGIGLSPSDQYSPESSFEFSPV